MKRLKDFRIRFGEGRVSNSERNHSPLLAPNDKPLQEIEETADHFHHTINKVHHNLKFELEKPEITPSGLSLSLLDFKVTISKDGNSSFEFYKKPAKKPLFVHHQSAIPTKSKIKFIATNENASRQMLLTPKHIR